MNKTNIRVNPQECKGCLVCQLLCSLAYTGAFNPEKARIIIEPLQEISFTDDCIENRIGGSLPPCQAACPLHVDVKGYITLIAQGRFEDALRLIEEKVPFPGIMGRVCTHPCEAQCERAEVDEAIAIAALKRCAADYAEGVEWDLSMDEQREERIAIIGSGPAGLMAAYDLRKKGYQVTIFEALPFPGGMLRVGILEYRLPREVLQSEIARVLSLGIELKLNSPVHKLDDLFDEGYQAIFIAIGLHQGRKLPIAGADLDGALIGLSLLRDVNLGQRVKLGQKVLVLGGGGVACDVARVARRLGVPEVHMACLESREAMPAHPWEVQGAEEEGVSIHPSRTFAKILGDNGHVTGVECLTVKWMMFDEQGQLHLETIEGSEHILEADTVIFAIGQELDLTLTLDGGINLSQGGTIAVNPVTLETGCPGVFAGGDAVTGPASVIDALAAGRKAAISIDRYVNGQDLTISREGEGAQASKLVVDIQGVAKKERVAMPTLAVDWRRANFQEVELGLSKEEAEKEAERCLSCECKLCVKYCPFGALEVVR
jgi:NADPH-dependent glutamate synthase beta subunit-like oxidoreductase